MASGESHFATRAARISVIAAAVAAVLPSDSLVDGSLIGPKSPAAETLR